MLLSVFDLIKELIGASRCVVRFVRELESALLALVDMYREKIGCLLVVRVGISR